MSAVGAHQLLDDLVENPRPFGELSAEYKRQMAEEFAGLAGFGKYSAMWFESPTSVEPSKMARWGKTDQLLKRIALDDGERPRSVFIAGRIGNGKSGWLAAMFKEWFLRCFESEGRAQSLVDRFRRFRFITNEGFIDVVHRGYKEQLPKRPLWIREFAEVDVLCFDDFGGAQETEHNLVKLEALIEYRNRHDLTTWMASNFSLKDMRAWPGWKRIASRLGEHRWMTYHEVAINDRRQGALTK